MKIVTQAEIARQLGISRSAVAKGLHARLQMQLSPHNRQRVLAAAERLGYVPHQAAQRLIRTRFRKSAHQFDQVGLIYLYTTDLDKDPVCLRMMSGAEHEISRLHASLNFIRVAKRGDWEKVERLTRAGGVDGWLLYGAVNDEAVNRLKSAPLSGVPHVILGDHRCTQPVHSVNVDHATVGRLAAEHLASLGHRRIALFGGGKWFVYQEQIIKGFRAAVKELVKKTS